MLWSFMETVGEPGVSPRGPSRYRYARLLLPCSGSLGHWFPTLPTRSIGLPAIGTMIRSDCQEPISGAFGSPSPPPIPCITLLSLCSLGFSPKGSLERLEPPLSAGSLYLSGRHSST